MRDGEAVRRWLSRSINRVRWSDGDVQRIAAHVAKHGGVEQRLQAPEYSPVPTVVTATPGDGPNTFTFTISTASVDSYGDTIAVAGWQLAKHRSNPVVLWAHDSSLVPVGKATRTWIESGRLKSTVELAPASANPAAEQVRQLINGGFLSACSVGFTPIEWTFTTDKNRPMGIDFKKQVLLEWSICSVPANSDCVIDPGQTDFSKSVGFDAGFAERAAKAGRTAAALRQRNAARMAEELRAEEEARRRKSPKSTPAELAERKRRVQAPLLGVDR
jgi:HK97 family phage prohead protease